MQAERVVNSATMIAALCALVMTGVVVRREFWGSRSQQRESIRPVTPARWQQATTGGHRLGPADAAVVVVEFGDCECPACASFARTIRRIRQAFPEDVALVYRHYPLDYHPRARPLAVAAVCADKMGRFETFYDTVYASQREAVTWSMAELSRRSGIADTVAFEACTKDALTSQIVENDLTLAKEVEAQGTPTILARGKMWTQLVDSAMVDGWVGEERKK